MDEIKADIFSGKELMFENITVYITLSTDRISNLKEWRGIFYVPITQDIDTGGPYRIELKDGRSGNILITNIKINFQKPCEVFFVGSGPLK